MKTLAELNLEIEETEAKISLCKKQFPALLEEFSKIENPLYVYFYPEQAQIIAALKTRAEFANIRALHKGKWERDVKASGITYTAHINGIRVFVEVCEFPPTCKIVEETVHIEAHDEIKRTVVCSAA